MQSRIASILRSLRLPRFDAVTGKRRKLWPALAGGVALALLLGSGIVVATAGAAEAHSPSASAICTGVQVKGENYAGTGPNGEQNTAEVTVDGTTLTIKFSGTYVHFFDKTDFPNLDSTVSFHWNVKITPWNATKVEQPGWYLDKSGDSEACAPPSVIKANAPECSTINGSTSVSAEFNQLNTSHTYTVTLSSSGGTNFTQNNFTPPTASNVQYPASGSPAAQTAWGAAVPGVVYTITITDTSNTQLTASTTVKSVGCPKEYTLSIDYTECSVENGTGTFVITADVVDGRHYVVTVYKDNVAQAPIDIPAASSSSYSTSINVSPLSTYKFTITDVSANITKTSDEHKYLPCPKVPNKPVLTVQQCSAVAPASSNASIKADVDDLVLTRDYTITITRTGDPNPVYTETLTNVQNSHWDKTLTGLVPDTYTVTVTDVTVQSISARTLAALPGFTNSESTTLIACPEQPALSFSLTQCTVPTGDGGISATVTDFAPGRTYSITLTQNGLAVPGQPVIPNFTPTDKANPPTFTWTGLAAGQTYRIIVTDVLVPAVKIVGDVTLNACPGNPDITITQAECSVLGTSKVQVDLGKLVSGETYAVSIVTTAGKTPVPGVPDQQVPGNPSTASVVFTGVPNGVDYTVSVSNVAKTLTAVGTILLEICDPPTFPLPPDLPTLAFTGTSTMAPTIAGIGFLQLGLVLVGVGLLRRRSGASQA
jgi:uncharacterized membrane protein